MPLNKKIAVIIQPSFLPWRGYVDLMSRADSIVLLDTVQWVRAHWFNRNLIDLNKKSHWITVPVETKGNYVETIDKINISYQTNWQRKMLTTIKHAYARTEFFDLYFPKIEKLINQRWTKISSLSEASLNFYIEAFGLKNTLIRASSLQIEDEDAVVRLIEICHALGANKYLSPPAARAYIRNDTRFAEAGIELSWMEYDYPDYQNDDHGNNKELSAIDLLFKYGPSAGNYIWAK